MHYITIFDATDQLSKIEMAKKWDEWVDRCRDDILQHGCRDIETFETLGNNPYKLFFLIDSDTPEVIDLLRNHFGPHLRSETYAIHHKPGLKDDHAVVAG